MFNNHRMARAIWCRKRISVLTTIMVTGSLLGMSLLTGPPAGAVTNAARWPMYMGGPTHSGWQPNENTITPANASHLGPRWIQPLTAPISSSSPVVANGAVYIGDEGGSLYKRDVRTGAAIWTQFFGGLYSAPAVGNHQAFAADFSGDVGAIDDKGGTNPNYGKVIWSHQIPSGNFLVGPTLVGNTLYVANDAGDVIAWDASYRTATSGTMLWKVNIGECPVARNGGSSPTVLGATVYIGACDGRLLAISPATGSATPTVSTVISFPGGAMSNTLSSDGTRLYTTVSYNSRADVHVVAVDPTASTPLQWDRDLLRPAGGSGDVAVANGTVYAPDDIAIAYLSAADGGYKTQAVSVDNYPTTPTVANGVVYTAGIGFGGGNIGAIQAFDATTALMQYFAAIPDGADTSPAVANGMVFVGSGSGLYAYHLAVG
jgi:outer membrane protein assembly factor BamB